MLSRLSSTTLSQLTPLLGSLARLVAEGSHLSAEEYEVLLDMVSLDADSAVLDEVQRWGRLLIKLHTQPTPTLRRVTVEALMLRGLPEAPVLLAVAAVAAGSTPPAPQPHADSSSQLQVTPERLDFGTLSAVAPVTATFEITGGVGHIVVESDYVRVTPTQFGPGATRVQVEVLPLAGGVLWTTLKLVTASASLEVPVMAQWDAASLPQTGAAPMVTPAQQKPQAAAPPQPATPNDEEPPHPADAVPVITKQVAASSSPHKQKPPSAVPVPPQPTAPNVRTPPPQSPLPPPQPAAPRAQPATIVVTPTTNAAESGRQLLLVLTSAPTGATIILQAGTYEITQPLVIDKPLILKGAGKDQTRLRCAAEGSVARFVGAGPFVVAGISFEHTGTVWGHAVEVANGKIAMQGCRFTGGVWDQAGARGGSGLSLLGQTRGTVAQCEMVGNERDGIAVGEQAQPSLEANTCRENKLSGIGYRGSAGGTARQNTCTANKLHGIYVGAQAQPTLEANTCQQNKWDGIGYRGNAGGTARQNTCTNNEHGIAVGEQAQPTLEANTCQKNKQAGIGYGGSAGGIARQNTCTTNKQHGIAVYEQAQPTLEANTCQQNKWAGIGYRGGAGGTARQNTCTANEQHGIAVYEQAQPMLEANTCQKNKQAGISYGGSAKGTARQNTCSANDQYGIFVGAQAQPTLEANISPKNHDTRISAGGRAVSPSPPQSPLPPPQPSAPRAESGAPIVVTPTINAPNVSTPPPLSPLPPPQPSAPNAQPGAPIVVTLASTAAESGRQLLQALASAPAGATITLQAGTYEVVQPLVVDKPLILKGAGKEWTRLRCAAEGYVVRFVGAGPFVVAGISFEHTGTIWAQVVEIASGVIDMQGCWFTGGVLDQAGAHGGNGLSLLGQTRGTVAQCEMVGNEAHGIFIGEQAQPTLKANTCQNNKLSGIGYIGSAGGTARQNTCTGNEQHGIFVYEQAQPTLVANSCHQNKGVGIGYWGNAGGTAQQNTCTGNGQHGIYAGEQTQPTLRGNVSNHNLRSGIGYRDNAGGSVEQNTCTNNEQHGISVGEEAQPTLVANTCKQNQLSGIAYNESARGAARQNICSENKQQGINIDQQSEPIVEANQCADNHLYGILIANTANPTLRDNVCAGNRGQDVNDQRKKWWKPW